jgi:uncharacterized membrane protein YgcG
MLELVRQYQQVEQLQIDRERGLEGLGVGGNRLAAADYQCHELVIAVFKAQYQHLFISVLRSYDRTGVSPTVEEQLGRQRQLRQACSEMLGEWILQLHNLPEVRAGRLRFPGAPSGCIDTSELEGYAAVQARRSLYRQRPMRMIGAVEEVGEEEWYDGEEGEWAGGEDDEGSVYAVGGRGGGGGRGAWRGGGGRGGGRSGGRGGRGGMERHCVNCDRMGHWFDRCYSPYNLERWQAEWEWGNKTCLSAAGSWT